MKGIKRYVKRTGVLFAVLLCGLLAVAPTALAAPVITEYTTPAGSSPHGMAIGPDGNMWFTEFSGNKIGVMSPAGVLLNEYTIPTSNSQPNAIVLGPDGNMWFTEYGAAKIGVMSPTGTVLNEYTTAANPHEIIVGPDNNLWFTNIANGKIGRITTGGVITYFPTATTLDTPYGITVGPNNHIWYTQYGVGEIGEMDTSGVVVNDFPLPTTPSGRRPYDITMGGDGNIWFTGENGRISKLTPSGALTEYAAPSGTSSDPHGITTGPDGNVWFTERAAGANKIGMITADGTITEYAIPTASSAPFSIAKGPNNTLWFSEAGTNKLGVISGISVLQNGSSNLPASPTIPSAPDTGFGVVHSNIVQPIIVTLLGAVAFSVLAITLSRSAKRRTHASK